MQGKSKKKFRILRAAGPLTPVILGTVFVKIFHPQSISVVRYPNLIIFSTFGAF